ncbi:hypothetical protein NDA18_000555 [Ustilago nuda]|nr:hypothetical protein NDA18_000555 [Ustilago nuda]
MASAEQLHQQLHPGFPHVHHHPTLKETLQGDDKTTSAESVSSSRSGSPSPNKGGQHASAKENGDGAPKTNGDAEPSSSSSGPRGSAYKIKLHCRSFDPIADSQTLPPDELPSHWVPTVISQLSRVSSTAFGNLTFPRNSTSSLKQQKSQQQEQEENEKEESHMLHRLTFVNPWQHSFRKPSIKTVLNGGLKWGLPDNYIEGSGKKFVRASGFKSNKKIARELEGAKADLVEGWDNVEVVDPDWGWPASGLKKEVDHIRQKDDTQPESKMNESDADDKAKEKSVKEWQDPTNPDKVAARVTWLGHASTLLQLPPLSTSTTSASGGGEDVTSRSINILFDPIFSERCSPSQSAGPQRFTPAPCSVDDLPPIDFVIISHSHYDHLDYHTFRQLRHHRADKIHAIVPLGVKDKLTGSGGLGWHKDQVSELDWWDNASLTIPSSSGDSGELKIFCTPAQHGSGRGAGDKDATLWASWVVQWQSSFSSGEKKRFSAFFAGDTGLKFHPDSPHKRSKYPACPAFADIAKKFAPFHLLLLPISVGSSLSYFRSWDPFPRAFSPFPRVANTLTSSIHMDPYDAVECHGIFNKNGAKKGGKGMVSMAVHYGTFVRNEEQTRADVRGLRKACSMQKLKFRRVKDGSDLIKGEEEEKEERAEDVFLVADQGKTVWLPIRSSS